MSSFFGARVHELIASWRAAFRRSPWALSAVTLAFIALALASVVGGAWVVETLHGDGLPDQEAMRRIGEMDQATAVYDDTDSLVFTIFKEQRIDVPLEQISPNLIHAIVAIEDQRFYEHHGFDVVRIMSAALANIRHRRAAQGGSTITQQLARQSFLTPDKTIHRKVQEIVLAARIERLYSKRQILELYLNKVYFGDGLHGVEAASRGFFGKHASELSIPEAALLAGLVKSPSSYAPTVSLPRATSRRNVVLNAMYESGAIDRATWQSARATKVALHDTLRETEPHGLYFKEQVRQDLVDRFGWQRVYRGRTARVFDDRHARADRGRGRCRRVVETDRGASARARGKARLFACERACVRAAAGRTRRARSEDRPCSRDGRWPRLQRKPFQPRGPGASSAWVGVQAVRVRHGTRKRLYACDGHRSPERSDCDAAGRMDARGRAFHGRLDEPARRTPDVEQSRRGSAAAGGGDSAHRAVREKHGRR